MRKSMWRPDTAGWSMQTSQPGWRLTTIRTRKPSSLAPESRARGVRSLQLVVDVLHAFDRARHVGRGIRLGLRVHDAHELRHALAHLDGELRIGGALVAAQCRTNAPFERQVLHHAHGFGS